MAPPPLDPYAPGRRKILNLAQRLIRYHRRKFESPAPKPPVIYVTLHGAGYLVLDLVMSGYFLSWKEFVETGLVEAWRAAADRGGRVEDAPGSAGKRD